MLLPTKTAVFSCIYTPGFVYLPTNYANSAVICKLNQLLAILWITRNTYYNLIYNTSRARRSVDNFVQ